MTGLEVAAVVGPIATLLGSLGGVWLTLHYQHDRELRDAKRVAYIRWLQFAENVATWAFQPDAHFSDFLKGLHDRKAELELVASPKVQSAVQDHLDAMGPLAADIQEAIQHLGPRASLEEQAVAMGTIVRTVDNQRGRVLRAMRQDLGFK